MYRDVKNVQEKDTKTHAQPLVSIGEPLQPQGLQHRSRQQGSSFWDCDLSVRGQREWIGGDRGDPAGLPVARPQAPAFTARACPRAYLRGQRTPYEERLAGANGPFGRNGNLGDPSIEMSTVQKTHCGCLTGHLCDLLPSPELPPSPYVEC
ncbi:hypothetical protein LY78DRAFT_287586 [Colletotrichum sublineola]|nr:hypothetical protein LY78DRAFT_287586 [Colletotrichum sublineola]